MKWNKVRLPADMDAEISSDCARLGFSWVSVSYHFTWCLDYIGPLPYLNKSKAACVGKTDKPTEEL